MSKLFNAHDMRRFVFLMLLSMAPLAAFSQIFLKKILLDEYYGREAEFGDFDRDGDLDILMFYTADDAYGEAFTRILENKGTEFLPLELGFPGVEAFGASRNGAANWVDFNNDGYLDVFLVIGRSFSVEMKLYLNNGDKTFTEKLLNVNELVLGGCGPVWADFDNDGDSDLTVYGDKEFNKFTIKIYENNPDQEGVSALEFDFGTCILKSRRPWGDFNNDGLLDLMANERVNNYQSKLVIFKNNGDRTFTKIVYPELQGLNQDILNQMGDMQWGDYNHDGYLDILISGDPASPTGEGLTALYTNNGDETFDATNIDGVYPTDSDVSIEWGDYDCDGDLDILQTGEGDNPVSSHGSTWLYINKDGTFEDSGIRFLQTHQVGMSTSGDYNGDNKLDLLVLGQIDFRHHQIALYENWSMLSNTPPLAPGSLTTQVDGSLATLSWARATDAESEQKSLTYNVHLFRGNDAIVQPGALQNGKRIVVGMGNAQHGTSYTVTNLKPGFYRWAVQSIDNSFIGSKFSKEETFEIPEIVTANDEELSSIEPIKVFPNPFNTEIIVASDLMNERMEIVLFDHTGRAIYREENVELPLNINAMNLSSGLYILSVKKGLNAFYKKLVKR